jgi:hypothetical protein
MLRPLAAGAAMGDDEGAGPAARKDGRGGEGGGSSGEGATGQGHGPGLATACDAFVKR